MDRRTFGATLFAGAVGLVATPVLAQGRRMQGMGPMGPAERRHAVDTLGIGGVSLQTSRLALSRANRPMVRQFAQFEADEATSVAQIVTEISGLTPPPPTPADRALINRLSAARGPAFDRDYIVGQIDGHQRLLRVQDRYLAEGRNMHNRHIATLARGRILEHIRDLENLQRMRG